MVVNLSLSTVTVLPSNGGPHLKSSQIDLASRPYSDSASALSFGPILPTPFFNIHQAFRYHAITQPNVTAVEHLGQSLSYDELDRASHHMAWLLRAWGVRDGSHVCLLTKRGLPMVASILAVLKCGAVYIPLDSGITTDATLHHVLRDSGAQLVLSSSSRLPGIKDIHANVVDIEELFDRCRDLVRLKNRPAISSKVRSSSGAYIIYTSGTTGKPKGVLVTHGNVINLLCLPPGNLGMQPGMRVAQLLNIAFDMCVWEILGSLLNGCTLCIRGSEKQSWAAILRTVDVVISTPSILSTYRPADFPNIRIVATAGEPCPQQLADRWAEQADFFNCCGPTETTIVNTVSRHMYGQSITIGRPTPNNSVYILDSSLRPVSVGQVGVMWAGGAGVSNGYVNLPTLTEERYKPDPFLGIGLMFNTGDLGRLRADGQLEHLGRLDDQVKVKGFRVELDGVQAVLCNTNHVYAAACLLIEGELVAFVVPVTVDIDRITAEASAVLPYYAVPRRFYPIPELPLTSNGKIDKSSLREMAVART